MQQKISFIRVRLYLNSSKCSKVDMIQTDFLVRLSLIVLVLLRLEF